MGCVQEGQPDGQWRTKWWQGVSVPSGWTAWLTKPHGTERLPQWAEESIKLRETGDWHNIERGQSFTPHWLQRNSHRKNQKWLSHRMWEEFCPEWIPTLLFSLSKRTFSSTYSKEMALSTQGLSNEMSAILGTWPRGRSRTEKWGFILRMKCVEWADSSRPTPRDSSLRRSEKGLPKEELFWICIFNKGRHQSWLRWSSEDTPTSRFTHPTAGWLEPVTKRSIILLLADTCLFLCHIFFNVICRFFRRRHWKSQDSFLKWQKIPESQSTRNF